MISERNRASQELSVIDDRARMEYDWPKRFHSDIE